MAKCERCEKDTHINANGLCYQCSVEITPNEICDGVAYERVTCPKCKGKAIITEQGDRVCLNSDSRTCTCKPPTPPKPISVNSQKCIVTETTPKPICVKNVSSKDTKATKSVDQPPKPTVQSPATTKSLLQDKPTGEVCHFCGNRQEVSKDGQCVIDTGECKEDCTKPTPTAATLRDGVRGVIGGINAGNPQDGDAELGQLVGSVIVDKATDQTLKLVKERVLACMPKVTQHHIKDDVDYMIEHIQKEINKLFERTNDEKAAD